MCRVRNKLIPENLPTCVVSTQPPHRCFCYVLQILDAKKTHKFICEIYKHLWYKISASHGTASFFMKLRTLSQNKKTLSSIFLFKNLKKCKNFYINQIVRIKNLLIKILRIPRDFKMFSTFSWKVFIFCVLISYN